MLTKTTRTRAGTSYLCPLAHNLTLHVRVLRWKVSVSCWLISPDWFFVSLPFLPCLANGFSLAHLFSLRSLLSVETILLTSISIRLELLCSSSYRQPKRQKRKEPSFDRQMFIAEELRRFTNSCIGVDIWQRRPTADSLIDFDHDKKKTKTNNFNQVSKFYP